MRIACLMMQKNEDLLLEPWIRYHAYIFGIDNLFVYDNGSISEATIETLRKFEVIGLNVDRRFSAPKDFDRKGVIVGEAIKVFRTNDRFDAVFALDCDEFVAITGDRGVSCMRRDILAYLDTFAGATAMVRVGHCLDNRPGFADLYRLATFRKSFIPVAQFKSVDHGFHEPSSLSDEVFLESSIVFIHMHFKPFELVKSHARDKLLPYVDTQNPAELAEFRGVGVHLVRYFSMSEDEYYTDLGQYRYPLVYYRGFTDVLRILMPIDGFLGAWCARPPLFDRSRIDRDVVELPGLFDASAYLQANPDVAEKGMNPVIHYCLFGYRERRPLLVGPPSRPADEKIKSVGNLMPNVL